MRTVAAILAALATTGCQWVPGTDAQKARAAKLIVAEELLDGSSARFEDLVVSKSVTHPGMVCGWVNAKNRMGAYVGAEKFLVADGRLRMLGSNVEDGWESRMGNCVAGNKKASDRLMRDVDRAFTAYEKAVIAASN